MKAEEAQGEGWVEEPAQGPIHGLTKEWALQQQGLHWWGGAQGCQAVPSPQLSQAPISPSHPQDSYFTEEIKTTWREPPPRPP